MSRSATNIGPHLSAHTIPLDQAVEQFSPENISAHSSEILLDKNLFRESELTSVKSSVVDPKLFFPDPDPTLTLISDSNPDPAFLWKIH
jgi:hypothetical protein